MKLILLFLLYIFCGTTTQANDNTDPILVQVDIFIQENVLIDDIEDSQCSFIITDRRGHLKNIQYNIKDPESQEKFEFKYKTDPDDNKTAEMVYLVPKKKLNYKEKSFYEFVVEMTDVANVTQSSNVTVQVYKAPEWTVLPSVLHLNEEENITIDVTASFSDPSPISTIWYCLIDPSTNECGSWVDRNDLNSTIRVGRANGYIGFDSIDRDVGISNFTVTVVAYDRDHTSTKTQGHILVLVDDIDDNAAIIKFENQSEGIVVHQNDKNVSIHIEATDPDLGPNAEYYARLMGPSHFEEAFELSPDKGIGTTAFQIKIDPQKLDYSESRINIQFVTMGVRNISHTDVLSLKIYLSGAKSWSTTWLILVSFFFSFFHIIKEI